MQKKLLSIILVSALTFSCSKGLERRHGEEKAKPVQNEAVNSNELTRQVVYFDTNSYKLSNQNTDAIKQALSSFVSSNKKLVILSEGYCDERGESQYNYKLGKKRAQAVKQFLVKNLKIKSSRISVVSYGENKPVALGHDENSWSKNRRVEIVVLK